MADEVICAFGRLGEWFGSAKYGVVPDLITFAKGSTSGYAPMGVSSSARSSRRGCWVRHRRGLHHGSTWGGHPVSAAVAVANISAMRHEDVLENVRRLEPRLQAGLDDILRSHRSVLEWRGTGLFYAIEFTGDRESGRNSPSGKPSRWSVR